MSLLLSKRNIRGSNKTIYFRLSAQSGQPFFVKYYPYNNEKICGKMIMYNFATRFGDIYEKVGKEVFVADTQCCALLHNIYVGYGYRCGRL